LTLTFTKALPLCAGIIVFVHQLTAFVAGHNLWALFISSLKQT